MHRLVSLIIGVALFAAVHLVPGLAPGRRQALWDRLGEGGYKGLFSLLLIAALNLSPGIFAL